MPGKQYLRTSTGGYLRTTTGGFVFRYLLARYAAQIAALNIWAPAGYSLYAKALATGTETYLGFIAADAAPLQLAGVNLADGDYELQVRVAAHGWSEHRCVSRWPVRVAGGAIVEIPPGIRNLDYSYTDTQTLVSWSWVTEPGTVDPDDFAVWLSASSPVNTSGAPDHVVTATAPGTYSQLIAQGAAVLYAAVCARVGATKGPVSEIEIPAPPVDVATPDNQAAYG